MNSFLPASLFLAPTGLRPKVFRHRIRTSVLRREISHCTQRTLPDEAEMVTHMGDIHLETEKLWGGCCPQGSQVFFLACARKLLYLLETSCLKCKGWAESMSGGLNLWQPSQQRQHSVGGTHRNLCPPSSEEWLRWLERSRSFQAEDYGSFASLFLCWGLSSG